MLESLERGDFYILCPDNDVTRALDEKRIAWAAGDIIENRPALSRWHPDHAEAFKAFLTQSWRATSIFAQNAPTNAGPGLMRGRPVNRRPACQSLPRIV